MIHSFRCIYWPCDISGNKSRQVPAYVVGKGAENEQISEERRFPLFPTSAPPAVLMATYLCGCSSQTLGVILGFFSLYSPANPSAHFVKSTFKMPWELNHFLSRPCYSPGLSHHHDSLGYWKLPPNQTPKMCVWWSHHSTAQSPPVASHLIQSKSLYPPLESLGSAWPDPAYPSPSFCPDLFSKLSPFCSLLTGATLTLPFLKQVGNAPGFVPLHFSLSLQSSFPNSHTASPFTSVRSLLICFLLHKDFLGTLSKMSDPFLHSIPLPCFAGFCLSTSYFLIYDIFYLFVYSLSSYLLEWRYHRTRVFCLLIGLPSGHKIVYGT